MQCIHTVLRPTLVSGVLEPAARDNPENCWLSYQIRCLNGAQHFSPRCGTLGKVLLDAWFFPTSIFSNTLAQGWYLGRVQAAASCRKHCVRMARCFGDERERERDASSRQTTHQFSLPTTLLGFSSFHLDPSLLKGSLMAVKDRGRPAAVKTGQFGRLRLAFGLIAFMAIVF